MYVLLELLHHDIIEHFRDDNGSVEHELMALGALLYGRYQMGLIYGHSLSLDFCYLFMNYMLNTSKLINLNYKHTFSNKNISISELDNILFDAKDYIIEECHGRELELTENVLLQITDYLTTAKKWMIKGFYRAKRKYKDPYIMTELFNKIEKVASKYNGDYGMKLKITYQIQPEIKVWGKEYFSYV